MNKAEYKIADMILNIAIKAEGRKSLWGMYQPEEPWELINKLKKNLK